MYFSDEIEARIVELRQKIASNEYTVRVNPLARSSIVWEVFNEILNVNGEPIDDFFYCTVCRDIEHRTGGSTTKLLRHSCIAERTTSSSLSKIDKSDIEKVKSAAAKLVCFDLRPMYAVDCDGAREFFMAGVALGKKYPKTSTDQLMQFYPSRKSVKTEIKYIASEAKQRVKNVLNCALTQAGGFGCTLDLWSDKYRHSSYMAMTANVYLPTDECIEIKRIVFAMEHITEIFKSKELIKTKIIGTLANFGVSEEDMKKITFTTDR